MLTSRLVSTASFFDELRAREFARLDAARVAYLDYAGSALYAESHLDSHRALLARSVLGNPHSEHASSQASTRAIDAARRRVLSFLDAGDDYVVIFTANTSAAIKLVAEAYPFGPDASFALTADNHNSINGVREYARHAGAEVTYLPLRADLRLDHPEAHLDSVAAPGLFALPAQSNFSGVHHPLSLVRRAQDLGFHVLLDAAAFVPAHPLSLRQHPADFVALSFYKIFGYPGGVGALVARRDALDALRRPWFAGGTVEFASVQLERFERRPFHEGFEDGTANFLNIAALEPGFALLDWIGRSRVWAHVSSLARELADGLDTLRHRDGSRLVRRYGEGAEGSTVTFNVLDRDGHVVPYGLVENRANANGVQVRGGCFCNPGAAEAVFGADARRMARGDAAGGAVRASLGLANNRTDVRRALDVVVSFAS